MTTSSTLIMLVLPLAIRSLIDSASSAKRGSLAGFLALLAVLFVLRGFLNFGGQYLLRMTAERASNEFRARVYAHVLTLDSKTFHRLRVADIMSRLTNDVQLFRVALSDTSANALGTVVRLVGSAAIILSFDRRLAAAVFIIAPIASVLTRSLARRIRLLTGQLQATTADSAVVVQEGLQGLQLVQSFVREDFESDRYTRSLSETLSAARRLVLTGTRLAATLDSVSIFVMLAVYGYGGGEVAAGRLSVGQLVAAVLYAQNLTAAIGEVMQTWVSYSGAAAAFNRLIELLALRPTIVSPAIPRSLSNQPRTIEFERVVAGYDECPVLRAISFSVEAGRTVAVTGPSGAGKTTLLRLVLRLIDPTSGRVLLGGLDVRSLSLSQLRSEIAVVSQDVYLFNTSIRENIRYGRLNATDSEVERAAEMANIGDFIRSLPEGFDTVVREGGSRLSGGQRQRIAIARALLKNAPILILDEATSAIDAVSESSIQDALASLRHGRTTMVVTHRLSSIRDADAVLLLKDGELIDSGRHDDLTARSPLYAALARERFGVGSS